MRGAVYQAARRGKAAAGAQAGPCAADGARACAGGMGKAHWGTAAPLASIETHFVTKCNTKMKIFKN